MTNDDNNEVSCFISYSTKDEAFCQKLHDRMVDAGLKVWFAPESLKQGDKLYEQIKDGIARHDRLLIVLSKHSMNSEWVKTELRHARKREVADKCQILFPVRLCSFKKIKEWELFDADTGKDIAVEIREYFIPGDFEKWKDDDVFDEACNKLIADLTRAGAE